MRRAEEIWMEGQRIELVNVFILHEIVRRLLVHVLVGSFCSSRLRLAALAPSPRRTGEESGLEERAASSRLGVGEREANDLPQRLDGCHHSGTVTMGAGSVG